MVRRTFLFFIASIPFEETSLPLLPGSFSVAKISGLLFFGCCLWYPKTCFRRPTPAVLWFAGYLIVYFALGLFIPAELQGALPHGFMTLVMLLAFFWLGSALLQNIHLAKQAFFTFGAASAGLAVAVILRLPGFAATSGTHELRGVSRVTALDYNPNNLAAIMGLAAAMLIGLLLDNTRRTRGRAWLLACLTPPLLILLVGTSSRGGLMAFVLGTSLFLVPLAPSRRRIAAFAFGIFALIALGVMVARDPLSATRWTETVEEGRDAGRGKIWAQGVPMVLERPILGWGPVEYRYELGSRLNLESRDPHNLFLGLLLEGGIVGAFVFLAGFWLCVRAAWKSRAGPEGILPLALIVICIVLNLFGNWFDRKWMWLVLAIALASPVVRVEWQRAVSLGSRRAPEIR